MCYHLTINGLSVFVALFIAGVEAWACLPQRVVVLAYLAHKGCIVAQDLCRLWGRCALIDDVRV